MLAALSAPAAPSIRPSTIEALITSRLSVAGTTPVGDAVRLFDANPECDTVAVTGLPRMAALVRGRFFLQLGKRFGYALFEKRPTSLLAEEASTVECGADPVEVVTLATQRDQSRIYDDILVVDAGRYAGTVSMRSLLAHHKDLLADSLAELAALERRARQLEELNRVQKEFMANMTHELRTPLSVMLGLVRATADDPQLAPGHRHGLLTALSRGQELLGIVNDVLDAAKMEAGALLPLVEVVDLPTLLGEVVDGVRPLLGARPVELKRTFTAVPDRFATDPVFLRRLLTNLLGNAVKFTAQGSVTLLAEGQPRGGLLLAVADTGAGIRAEDLPRLFTRFTQLDSGPARRHGGTGLGLAIVKGLVERLGGTVEAASRPGQGSTFTVRLPALRPELQEAP